MTHPNAPAVVPRAAATVVLVRERPGLRPGSPGAGIEVLLGRRPPTMAFAPNVSVFPGGAVDAGDAHPSLVSRSVRTPEEAAEAVGGDLSPTEAIAAHIAVIREAFEEAGVLLADLGRPASGRDLAAARAALVAGEAGFAAIASQLDLRLRTDSLVPISRWVTPPPSPRRFDTRFFVARLPDGQTATLLGDEVVDQVWIAPGAALDAMAGDRLALWPPTSTTLQQLQYADGFDAIRDRLAVGRLGEIVVEEVGPDLVRVEMPAAGGVAGQTSNAYLVGRRSVIIVDPSDPTGPALDRAIEVVAARGGTIRAVALTHVDPAHAAGSAPLAERLGSSILVGPGGARTLSYPVSELADGDRIVDGDLVLRVITTPGIRPDHVSVVVEGANGGDVVLAGDVDGTRETRSISMLVDDEALEASRARLDAAAPGLRRLGGHG